MKTTLWDNGAEKKVTKNGNTGKRTRYTVTIEAYTMPLERLVTLGLINTYQFKGTCSFAAAIASFPS